MGIKNLEELNKWASQLSPKEIENLPEEEILNYVMERPGHPGQYGFMLQIQYFKSEENFTAIMCALLARIEKIDRLGERTKRR